MDISIRQQIEQALKQLPPEGVIELVAFIEFLRFKYRLAPSTEPALAESDGVDIPSESLTVRYRDFVQSPSRVTELPAAYETVSYETILSIIHNWPPTDRLMLLQDILQSLIPEPTPSRPRRSTLQKALGLLATDQPPPSDAEVKQWLAEHRLEKYG